MTTQSQRFKHGSVSAHLAEEAEEEGLGVVLKDCHVYLFSTKAVGSDIAGSGGDRCCR